MMRGIGEIERTFGEELKQEIANSKLVLFDQYYWYARFKEACLIFPDLDYRKIRPKIMMKYVLSRLKSCRQAKKSTTGFRRIRDAERVNDGAWQQICMD